MSLNDQKEFLELANKYLDLNSVNDEERKWYYEWKNYAESQNHFDSNLLLKIMCIHSTNSFEDNGPVGIKVSRINHSCCPNSQHMVTGSSDGEMETLEIRATSKISEGQEISISYTPLMKNFKERQELCNEFGFVCSCEICQDEELNNDDETYEQ